jgi:hypothetical protein
MLLKGVAVVCEVADAVCVRREYFAAMFDWVAKALRSS